MEQIDPSDRPLDDYDIQQKLKKAEIILQEHFGREYYCDYVEPVLKEARERPDLIQVKPRFKDERGYSGFVFLHACSLMRELTAKKAHLNGLSEIGLTDFVNGTLEPLIVKIYAHQYPEGVLS